MIPRGTPAPAAHRAARAAARMSAGGVEVHHLPPQWQPTARKPSLPIGVAIFSFVVAIGGLILLLAGVLFLLSYYSAGLIPNSLLIVRSIDAIGAAILVLLGAILLGLASALWDQETWGLYTTLVVLFLGLTYLFFTASITVLFIVILVLFVYLLAVRRHFY